MKGSSLRAVILDFGNVLSMPQDASLVSEMVKLSGLDTEGFAMGYAAHRFEYDRGNLDSETYWAKVLRTGGLSASQISELDGTFVQEMTRLDVESWTVIRDPMVAWVRTLKACGFMSAILSNMPADHARYIERAIDWLDLFDARVFSYAVGEAKPDPPIYRECLTRLGISPNEGLFIDDTERNVNGARAVGLPALHFRDTNDLSRELRQFPELPPLRAHPA